MERARPEPVSDSSASRPRAPAVTRAVQGIRGLQRTAGNRAVLALLRAPSRKQKGKVIGLDPARYAGVLGGGRLTLDPAARPPLSPREISQLLATDLTLEPEARSRLSLGGGKLELDFDDLFFDPTEVAVRELRTALAPVAGLAAPKELWDAVAKQVVKPTKRRPSADLPAALYRPSVVAALNDLALSSPAKAGRKPRWADKDLVVARRGTVLEQVFDALAAARDRALDPKADGPDVWEEWKLLAPVQKVFGDKIENFRAARPSLMVAFGALEVSSGTALDRLIRFYRDEIVDQPFCGTTYRVHEKLASRLEAASTRLRTLLKGAPEPVIPGVGDLAVRANHNEPWSLSKHTFGLAVDLAPTDNPNIPGYIGVSDFVEAITGVDTRSGASGTRNESGNIMQPGSGKARHQLTTAEALPEAKRLRDASDEFVKAFADEPSMRAAMVRVARRRGRPKANDAELLAAIDAAIAEGSQVEWRYEAADDATYVHHPKGHDRAKGAALPRGSAHEALARLLFPGRSGATDHWADLDRVQGTVELILGMADVYNKSFVTRGGKRERVAGTYAEPSLSQLAAHGFLNIAPSVIASLVGSDGGNLRWLGGLQKDLKDYMHFEIEGDPIAVLGLRKDRPPAP